MYLHVLSLRVVAKVYVIIVRNYFNIRCLHRFINTVHFKCYIDHDGSVKYIIIDWWCVICTG